ncbi:hypothetical protein [Motiliproteus sp. MSK22-1]|uniref:hypothetical protein n=1 Tax=Motiliproteus sp. MSK22-1 TaxID=1897630 RepID=UPI00097546F1|nr:hypothetical protein [Motiliproteus sp. MSK22-1]OMH39491.1 hypothetical protein BGP75_02555 [Motiliproteus sp. MSK22-1]
MTVTNKLFKVADSLLSEEEQDYIDIYLYSIETVQEYAWNQMSILLSHNEAARILVTCRRWIKQGKQKNDPSNAYFKMVEWPLTSVSLRLQAV